MDSHPPPDPLDRHQRRREQSIPTLSVLAGPSGLGMRRWRTWAASRNRAVVALSTPDTVGLVAAWIQSLCSTRDLLADAAAWLSRITGREPHELRRQGATMTGRDSEWFWTNLPIPSDRTDAAAVCRLLLTESGTQATAERITERFNGVRKEGHLLTATRTMSGLADLVPRDALPSLLLTPPTPGERDVWLVETARSLAQLVTAVPALPAALAVETSVLQAVLRAEPPSHALAVLREGIVPVEFLAEAEVTARLQGVNAIVETSATARRLADDGTSEELVAAFRDAACQVGRQDIREEEEAARSAAEKFLFERLETLTATADLFALNQQLDFHHGPALAEVDFLATSLRLVIELDGSYYHLRDATAYRRDRRKDWELQRRGYLVLRFLSDDVVERLEEILDTILAAVELRRAGQPKRGRSL